MMEYHTSHKLFCQKMTCNQIQGSLSVGHYELCRDDIGDLPGSPNHLCKEKTPMNIG